jgi:hypothetical protein
MCLLGLICAVSLTALPLSRTAPLGAVDAFSLTRRHDLAHRNRIVFIVRPHQAVDPVDARVPVEEVGRQVERQALE